MEEIHEAAMAYYHHLPEDLRRRAYSVFIEKDLDGDGKISKKEFLKMFEKLVADEDEAVEADARGYEKLFKELDQDSNGTLEFSEFLSFYYLHLTGRLLFCDGCQRFLKGLYFTCLHCFNEEGESATTHNVCSSCYRNGRHLNHHHENVVTFVDNYALLLSKIGCSNTSTSKWRFRKHKGSKSEVRKKRFDYFVEIISVIAVVGQWTYALGGALAAGATCTIM